MTGPWSPRATTPEAAGAFGAPVVRTPPTLYRLYEAGAISREELHAEMAGYARGIIAEMVEARRNPVSAYLEYLLNKRAAANLKREHGEAVVREALEALAEIPDFPPAIFLWNAGHCDVPLYCFLRTRWEPVFKVTQLDNRGMTVGIEVEYGSNQRRKATREAIELRRNWRGLLLPETRRSL